MSINVIDPKRDGLWPTATGHRFSSLFSSPPWMEAITRAYDLQISASARLLETGLDAAIPFCQISDLRGERVVCLPFSDYCDPLVEDVASWNELIEPILALAKPVTLRCLRNHVPLEDDRFTLTNRAVWHGIDLARSEDDLWAGLAASARQNIRKALRDGVVVRSSHAIEDMHTFHRMHCHVRKSKYRMLAQPAAFFESLHSSFSSDDRFTVILAEVDDKPVAGILFLEWDGTLYYKFNASIDQRFRPNDLLVWEGIRFGHNRGLARFDFGLSDAAQPGLVRFKSKFATEEGEISFLRWQPPDYADPRGDRAGQTLHRLTNLLTDPSVPDDITRASGEELYRFFC